MTSEIQPVILCGGAGTRLWPASRGARVKQFLALTDERTLFEMTIMRTAGRFPPPVILCGTAHVDLVREQAGASGARLVVEPEPRNRRMRAAMHRHCPAILDAAEKAIAAGERRGDRIDADPAAFAQAPSESIDYAVMEKDERIAVVPVSMGWSDLGSWQAVHALAPCDAAANGSDGNAFLHDSHGCLVRSGGKRVS